MTQVGEHVELLAVAPGDANSGNRACPYCRYLAYNELSIRAILARPKFYCIQKTWWC